MPKNTEIVKKEINTDANMEYFTGKYLVTAIRHQIINGKHMMDMEIVSDSFAKEITL
jgi:anti-sigma28 factor (negative regulator of flagellin synthesis)